MRKNSPKGGADMRIIEYSYPKSGVVLAASAVCLGFFDGVHLGHRALIASTVDVARERGLVPTVFTFPAETAALKSGADRIYTTEEKLRIFEELGVGAVVLCDFGSVSSLSPEEFVGKVLIADLGARIALSGEDFRFGHRAEGDSASLAALMRAAGLDAIAHKMERYELPCGSVEISATLIREYLSRGEVEVAAALLGAPYRISGEIRGGRGMGRTYGYPTINTELRSDILAHGVYHTSVRIGARAYTGLTNVGTCPSFGAREAHAETYLLDFSGDIYGEIAEISFLGYVREERVFESSEELAREIEKNIKDVLSRGSGAKGD